MDFLDKNDTTIHHDDTECNIEIGYIKARK